MTEKKSRYEEFQVAGDTVITRVRELIREGNATRLFIKSDSGEPILEIPLTAGVAIATVGAVISPVLIAVGAIAALFTRVTIGVEVPDKADVPA